MAATRGNCDAPVTVKCIVDRIVTVTCKVGLPLRHKARLDGSGMCIQKIQGVVAAHLGDKLSIGVQHQIADAPVYAQRFPIHRSNPITALIHMPQSFIDADPN